MSTENNFDLTSSPDVPPIVSIAKAVVDRERIRRKSLGYSQKELAERSGVSLASLRRFEQTGEISFSSLLKIANALNSLDDFATLFQSLPVKNRKDP